MSAQTLGDVAVILPRAFNYHHSHLLTVIRSLLYVLPIALKVASNPHR